MTNKESLNQLESALSTAKKTLDMYLNDYSSLLAYKNIILSFGVLYEDIQNMCEGTASPIQLAYDLVTQDHVPYLEKPFDFSEDKGLIDNIYDEANSISSSLKSKATDLDELMGMLAKKIQIVDGSVYDINFWINQVKLDMDVYGPDYEAKWKLPLYVEINPERISLGKK